MFCLRKITIICVSGSINATLLYLPTDVCKYTVFVFVHTLNKNTNYELKSIALKMGRSVPGRYVPHQIKIIFV